MRAATLKLKMYVHDTGIMRNSMMQKRVLHAIVAAFGALSLAYILILGNMVFNIVERRSLERELSALSSEVGVLELNYLSLSSSIDLELSYAMGFKEAKPAFATRKSLGYSATGEALGLNSTVIENEI